MSTDSVAQETPGLTSNLRKAPLLGCMIVVMMVCEKMLAHTYTAITIYVLPEPWKWVVPFIVGCLGVWLVLRGMGKDEVKGSLFGYLGAVLIWMSWFESGLPLMADGSCGPDTTCDTGRRQRHGRFAGGTYLPADERHLLHCQSVFYHAEQGRALSHVVVDSAQPAPDGSRLSSTSS
jgi:hypothetical protein